MLLLINVGKEGTGLFLFVESAKQDLACGLGKSCPAGCSSELEPRDLVRDRDFNFFAKF